MGMCEGKKLGPLVTQEEPARGDLAGGKKWAREPTFDEICAHFDRPGSPRWWPPFSFPGRVSTFLPADACQRIQMAAAVSQAVRIDRVNEPRERLCIVRVQGCRYWNSSR